MRKQGRAANRLGDEDGRGRWLCFEAQVRVHGMKRSRLLGTERSRHKAEMWGAGCVSGG